MLQDVEVETREERPILEIDPPAPAKPASLTGALVQRGRDRAAHAPEVPAGIEAVEAIEAPAAFEAIEAPAAVEAIEELPAVEAVDAIDAPAAEIDAASADEVPLVFAPRAAAAVEAAPSRLTDALFVLACCAAFFATFLFALRF